MTVSRSAEAVWKWAMGLACVLSACFSGCSAGRDRGEISERSAKPYWEDAAEPEEGYPVILEVRQQGEAEEISFVLTLRNSGNEDVVVDEELVFLVNVFPTNEKRHVRLNVKDLEPPKLDAAGWKKRFVTVPPGQSIARHIDLRKGFKNFEYGVAIRANGVEVPGGGSEAICSVPPEEEVTRVYINYGAQNLGFYLPFLGYTGLDPRDLNLFDGPTNPVIMRLRQSTGSELEQ